MSIDKKQHGFIEATLLYWCAVALLAALLFFFSGIVPQSGAGAGSGNGTSLTGKWSGDQGSSDVAAIAPASPESPTVATPSSAVSYDVAMGKDAPPETSKDIPDENIVQKEVPFEFRPVGTPDGASAASRSTGSKKGFFGVEVVRRERVIFLVDISGSMKSGSSGECSRIESLKKELAKVIQEMSRHTSAPRPDGKRSIMEDSAGKFRIACFSSSFSLTPLPAEKIWSFGNRQDIYAALDYVARLDSDGGGTNMLQAWQNLKTSIDADQIKVVYFLSDGEPNDGYSPTALLDYLRQTYPRLVIHTFSMGHASQLMQDIAKQHRGKYIEIH